MWKRFGLLLPVVAATQMGATDCGQITKDPGFDLWCGHELCSWKLERGQIERVPTWNEGDPGVSFVGDDVAIDQVTPVTSGDGNCIEFSMIANVALDAHVQLAVDVNGDGTIDATEDVPTTEWQPISFLMKIDFPYSGVIFEVTKTGSGEAVVAQLEARISDACGNDYTPIFQTGGGPGAPCEEDADCIGGANGAVCMDSPLGAPYLGKTCEQCTPNQFCLGSGLQICTAFPAHSAVSAPFMACLPPVSKPLGETCVSNQECASDKCNGMACSSCLTDDDCANGEACGPEWDVPFGVFTPWGCSPNGGERNAGEACTTTRDCASETCEGTKRKQCPDGRVCVTDDDCPFIDTEHSPCTVVGIEGGVCQ